MSKTPGQDKPKEPPWWHVSLPDGRWVRAQAWTKAEARAQAKEHFGLPALPAGTKAGLA